MPVKSTDTKKTDTDLAGVKLRPSDGAKAYGARPTIDMIKDTCLVKAFADDQDKWEAAGFKEYTGPSDRKSSSVYEEKTCIDLQKAED